ncbi:MAG: hypothetical protein ACREMT_09790, partial [Vulcanimicrobiaceae bacterium]
MSKGERTAEIVVAFWLLLAIVASGIFAADFALRPDSRLEGVSLGVAFVSIAAALIVWSRDLLGHDEVEDPQHPQRSDEGERESATWLLEKALSRV